MIAGFFYVVTGLGVTVGFHRYFTHGSFKANRPLKIVLAHRGQPGHGEVVLAGWPPTASTTSSPTRRATRTRRGVSATTGGRWPRACCCAHMGWLFDDRADQPASKYAPDLIKDPDIVRICRLFPCWRSSRWSLPAAARRPADLVVAGRADRVLLGHAGPRRAAAPRDLVDQLDLPRDRREAVRGPATSPRNVWWLAIPSFGESWHNLHHADPTCARHGVLQGPDRHSARVIRWFEKAGWAYDVRWPTPERLAAKRSA